MGDGGLAVCTELIWYTPSCRHVGSTPVTLVLGCLHMQEHAKRIRACLRPPARATPPPPRWHHHCYPPCCCAGLLSDAATLQSASLHYMGNIGVQRVFEAVVRLRAAYGPGAGKPQHPEVEAFMAAHQGRDPFGERVRVLGGVCVAEYTQTLFMGLFVGVCCTTHLVAFLGVSGCIQGSPTPGVIGYRN
jgi:hypothetical protein